MFSVFTVATSETLQSIEDEQKKGSVQKEKSQLERWNVVIMMYFSYLFEVKSCVVDCSLATTGEVHSRRHDAAGVG